MTISINTEKAFGTIHYPFMIKALKLQVERNFPNLIKNTYPKLTANIMLTVKKLEACPVRWKTRQRCSLSSLLFNTALEVQANPI
jgi:hypothetical protein